jgi:hypothetical protein
MASNTFRITESSSKSTNLELVNARELIRAYNHKDLRIMIKTAHNGLSATDGASILTMFCEMMLSLLHAFFKMPKYQYSIKKCMSLFQLLVLKVFKYDCNGIGVEDTRDENALHSFVKGRYVHMGFNGRMVMTCIIHDFLLKPILCNSHDIATNGISSLIRQQFEDMGVLVDNTLTFSNFPRDARYINAACEEFIIAWATLTGVRIQRQQARPHPASVPRRATQLKVPFACYAITRAYSPVQSVMTFYWKKIKADNLVFSHNMFSYTELYKRGIYKPGDHRSKLNIIASFMDKLDNHSIMTHDIEMCLKDIRERTVEQSFCQSTAFKAIILHIMQIVVSLCDASILASSSDCKIPYGDVAVMFARPEFCTGEMYDCLMDAHERRMYEDEDDGKPAKQLLAESFLRHAGVHPSSSLYTPDKEANTSAVFEFLKALKKIRDATKSLMYNSLSEDHSEATSDNSQSDDDTTNDVKETRWERKFEKLGTRLSGHAQIINEVISVPYNIHTIFDVIVFVQAAATAAHGYSCLGDDQKYDNPRLKSYIRPTTKIIECMNYNRSMFDMLCAFPVAWVEKSRHTNWACSPCKLSARTKGRHIADHDTMKALEVSDQEQTVVMRSGVAVLDKQRTLRQEIVKELTLPAIKLTISKSTPSKEPVAFVDNFSNVEKRVQELDDKKYVASAISAFAQNLRLPPACTATVNSLFDDDDLQDEDDEYSVEAAYSLVDTVVELSQAGITHDRIRVVIEEQELICNLLTHETVLILARQMDSDRYEQLQAIVKDGSLGDSVVSALESVLCDACVIGDALFHYDSFDWKKTETFLPAVCVGDISRSAFTPLSMTCGVFLMWRELVRHCASAGIDAKDDKVKMAKSIATNAAVFKAIFEPAAMWFEPNDDSYIAALCMSHAAHLIYSVCVHNSESVTRHAAPLDFSESEPQLDLSGEDASTSVEAASLVALRSFFAACAERIGKSSDSSAVGLDACLTNTVHDAVRILMYFRGVRSARVVSEQLCDNSDSAVSAFPVDACVSRTCLSVKHTVMVIE